MYTMALQASGEDVAQCGKLLTELSRVAGQTSGHIRALLTKVEAGQLHTAKGVSFLETKNQLMLSYLTNLAHLMSHKLKGRSLKGLPDVERLVEIRTVLEKMRPIDQKLRYQVDKLLKSATTGVEENDPLRLKPNAANMVSKLTGEDSDSGSEDSGDEDGESKPQVYKPPKLAAMHYEGDETEQERRLKQEERQRKRMMSSSIMKDLRSEYYDGPEEIREGADQHRHRDDKASKERQEYEENYFVRKQLTKRERASSRQLATMSGLGSLTAFGDGSMFGQDDGSPRKRQKTSSKAKGKGKKKGLEQTNFCDLQVSSVTEFSVLQSHDFGRDWPPSFERFTFCHHYAILQQITHS